MTRLVIGSALFALVAACSGSKHADESTPQTPVPIPNGSAPQTTDDAAAVPPPPTEGSQPSHVPRGMTAPHEADDQRVAQAPPDAGVRAPVRDAAPADAPRGVSDAGAAPGAPPADAAVPRPPGPGSASAPGSVPPTSPR